jgi:hypothetical protein
VQLELRLDKTPPHLHWLDLGKIKDAVLGAKSRELPDRLHVGSAGIRVPDVGAEEVAQPGAGFWPRRED